MAHHRLAHRSDRATERGQHPVGVDADLVVVRGEVAGDQIGVLELVALFSSRGLEADRERRDTVLPGFGEESDDQAGIQATRQQAAHRYVGDETAFHRGPKRGEDRLLPLRLRPVGALR